MGIVRRQRPFLVVEFTFQDAQAGVGQVAGAYRRALATKRGLPEPEDTPGRIWGQRILTFQLVCLGWVFFRADSISTAVANTNRLLLRLDSLARDAHALATENRGDLRATVTNLSEASRQLNNFVDQMSRRPLRALTGVKPLPPIPSADSARGPVGAKP